MGLTADGKETLLDEAAVTQIKARIERSGRNDLDTVVQVAGATTDLEMKQKTAEVMAWLMADRETLREQVAELEPKAAVADRIADATGLKLLSEVGKITGLGPYRIFKVLEEARVIYRNSAGDVVPYQEHVEAGRFVVRERTFADASGADHLRTQLYVTGKGEVWIAQRFARERIAS